MYSRRLLCVCVCVFNGCGVCLRRDCQKIYAFLEGMSSLSWKNLIKTNLINIIKSQFYNSYIHIIIHHAPNSTRNSALAKFNFSISFSFTCIGAFKVNFGSFNRKVNAEISFSNTFFRLSRFTSSSSARA